MNPENGVNAGSSNDANIVLDITSKPSRKKRKSEVTSPNDAPNTGGAQQKIRAKGKFKAGQLEGLMSVPMDVLFEIFGHLLPLDVLNLARTTKQFRRVLLHKSSVSVWKAARANILGLPECPQFMSEPSYANLAFDQHCHICLARNIRSVEWRFRLRICAKCVKNALMEINRLDMANELVPTRPSNRPSRTVCSFDELKSVQEHIMSLDDPDLRSEYTEQRKALVEEVHRHAIQCEIWAAETKSNRSQELEEVRQDRKKAIVDKLTDLGWGDEIEQLRSYNDLGLHPLVKQTTRLSDRIWKNIKAPLVQYMEDMKIQRLKRERQALVISRKPTAIGILRAYKILQLPFAEVMPEPVDFCAFPEVKAILELPNDVTVDESSFSEIVPLLPDMINRWRTNVIRKLEARVRQAHEDEQSLLRQNQAPASEITVSEENDQPKAEESTTTGYDPAQKLKLATTVFKCRKCGERYRNWHYLLGNVDLACHKPPSIADITYPLFYPQVLGHHCLTMPETDDYTAYANNDQSVTLNVDVSRFASWYSLHFRQSWDCLCLAVDGKSGERVAKIVEACGLDPATATADDMDLVDARLGCPNCLEWWHLGPNTARLTSFGWREALQHQSTDHHDDDVDWLKLGDGIVSGARELEKLLSDSISGEDPDTDTLDPPSGLVVWMCSYCLDLPSQTAPRELHNVKSHVRDKHQIVDPRLDIDYYKDFEAPQGYYTDTPNKIALLSLDLAGQDPEEP